MRIVIDDSRKDLVIKAFGEAVEEFKARGMGAYYNGWNHMDEGKIKNEIRSKMGQYGLTIGDSDVWHHQIGNNQAYAVYYDTPTETQHCCCLRMIYGMYGEEIVYLTDALNEKKLTCVFEMYKHRYKMN